MAWQNNIQYSSLRLPQASSQNIWHHTATPRQGWDQLQPIRSQIHGVSYSIRWWNGIWGETCSHQNQMVKNTDRKLQRAAGGSPELFHRGAPEWGGAACSRIRQVNMQLRYKDLRFGEVEGNWPKRLSKIILAPLQTPKWGINFPNQRNPMEKQVHSL